MIVEIEIFVIAWRKTRRVRFSDGGRWKKRGSIVLAVLQGQDALGSGGREVVVVVVG